MKSPEARAKVSEGLRRRYQADPERKERARENARRVHQLPQAIAARKERWKRDKPWLAGQAAQPKGSDARKRMAASLSEYHMAWCPPEPALREQYRFLVRSKKLKAAEARAIILEQHEKNMREFRRSIGA